MDLERLNNAKKKSLLRYYCKFVTDDNKLVMILKGPANLKNMLKNLLSYFYDTLVLDSQKKAYRICLLLYEPLEIYLRIRKFQRFLRFFLPNEIAF